MRFGSGTCGPALQRPPLVLAESAPDTMILPCFQRPLQACVSDVASPADLLGLLDLEQGRASVPDREEQLRVLVQTGGLMAPIHGVTHSSLVARDPGRAPACWWKPGILYTEALDSHQDFQVLQSIQGSYALVGSHFDTIRASFGVIQPVLSGCGSARRRPPRVIRGRPPLTLAPRRWCWPPVLLGVEALAAMVFGAVALTQIRSAGPRSAPAWRSDARLRAAAAADRPRRVPGRRWSRGPAVATQLILLPIALSFRAGPTTWVAGLIAVAAVGTLVGLLHPRSTEVFVGPPPPRRPSDPLDG